MTSLRPTITAGIPPALRVSAALVVAGAVLSSAANASLLYDFLDWFRRLLPAYLSYLGSTLEGAGTGAAIPVVTWPWWLNVLLVLVVAASGFVTTALIDGALIWCVARRKNWARPLIVLLDAVNLATIALVVPVALVFGDRMQQLLGATDASADLAIRPLTIVLLAAYGVALIAEVVALFRPAVRDFLRLT